MSLFSMTGAAMGSATVMEKRDMGSTQIAMLK